MYYNDFEKMVGSCYLVGWMMFGDVGYIDEDGYFYFIDCKVYMIICDGVNIYLQEVENVFIIYFKVYDCVVIGVLYEEFGEEVKGVVQLMLGYELSWEFEVELFVWCMFKLVKFKCFVLIDFEEELLCYLMGKFYKCLIKDCYWGKKDLWIV